jgi:hypothetical protein
MLSGLARRDSISYEVVEEVRKAIFFVWNTILLLA